MGVGLGPTVVRPPIGADGGPMRRGAHRTGNDADSGAPAVGAANAPRRPRCSPERPSRRCLKRRREERRPPDSSVVEAHASNMILFRQDRNGFGPDGGGVVPSRPRPPDRRIRGPSRVGGLFTGGRGRRRPGARGGWEGVAFEAHPELAHDGLGGGVVVLGGGDDAGQVEVGEGMVDQRPSRFGRVAAPLVGGVDRPEEADLRGGAAWIGEAGSGTSWELAEAVETGDGADGADEILPLVADDCQVAVRGADPRRRASAR